jgi:peptidoglycan/xylan/chitin deacetylase (PgdA/CDA1 family)
MVYAPDLLWRRKQADSGSRTPVSRGIGAGDRTPRNGSSTALTHRLPILRYHRVAPGNPESPAGEWISPLIFAEQMAHLHQAGYQTVTLEQWLDAMRRHQPLPGRAVIITFDDGYRHFSEHAWPVLREYGFGAYVYLVTDLIGQESAWNEIVQLREEGVQFGSHTATHPHLEALPPAQVVRELSRSRAALFRRTGPVTSIAYPSGSEDLCVQHLAGACGYVFGLTCCEGLRGFTDSPLALPRIEVKGQDTLAEFITKLGS